MSVAIKLSTLNHPIFEKLVSSHVQSGIADTVAKLGDFKVAFKPHFFSENWIAPSKISVLLNIKQGEQPLQVRLHFNPQPVVEILEGMLGEKVDPESADILDGISEICNMIYGLIKTKVSQSGFSLGLSRPEAFFTENIPHLNAVKHQTMIIPFTINTADCYFEFIAFE